MTIVKMMLFFALVAVVNGDSANVAIASMNSNLAMVICFAMFCLMLLFGYAYTITHKQVVSVNDGNYSLSLDSMPLSCVRAKVF